MKTFSFGGTPENIIRESLPDMYPMELIGDDWQIFEILQNQGIDSHLEAMACNGRDKIEVKNYDYCKKLGVELSKDAMICFLRRLIEYNFTFEPLQSAAEMLRSDILFTIGIEEI